MSQNDKSEVIEVIFYKLWYFCISETLNYTYEQIRILLLLCYKLAYKFQVKNKPSE